eukprot:TRINITY_DN3374_c0_g1_i1.p2 TRINITY_DN3374_c0_g1~~TRINITY_DN3374_c0_g1_i1.p2  ORF type:complete len:126 (+),score=44.48 TRINITY_DN3374_c0_g1_i1:374-751(+)
MGTVALGGAVNLMPVAFKSVQPFKPDLKRFRNTVVAALATVFVLNVFWCLFILQIVPQTPTPDNPNSLLSAAEQGQIATVPLIDTINLKYPDLAWIAICVDVFIMLSITVSFITMAIGMKHILDG